jgi:hypothetical protein
MTEVEERRRSLEMRIEGFEISETCSLVALENS